jgi:hypothetical protein
MDRKRPKKPFSLAGSKEPVVRDKDNAAPKIKPPEQTHLHHPRLAPPGMSGIRPTPPMMERGIGQAAARPTLSKDDGGPAKRAFKPIAKPTPEKDKGNGHQF